MSGSVTTIARGDGSRIVEPRRLVVRNAGEWRALWALHAGPDAAAPPVDFSSAMVVAVFAGERPSPGFEVEIAGFRRTDPGIEVIVHERAPGPERVAAQMIVTPFHIVSVPRIEGPARFGDDPSAPSARGEAAAPAASGRSAVSSTGLDPNFAAALAYLAGPFSGILVLMAERTSAYVRFHAYQSIVGLGGLGLIAAGLLLSAFLALLFSPSAFTVMWWLAFLTGGAWIILWAVSLVMAFTGRAWKLPLAGALAERRSSPDRR